MAPRVLLVDDEQRVLDGLRRTLGSRYELEFAPSGAAGLKMLARPHNSADPVAVVISDMMMPVMNGAEFLAQAHDVAPDAVLMILSGQADLRSTVDAVNRSSLFRFINKPCSPDTLNQAIDGALRQYQLVRAERDLLQQTLASAVAVLTETLALANPEAGSRSAMVTRLVERTAAKLHTTVGWELGMAARLSQLGLISIPTEVLQQVEAGTELSSVELEMYHAHPQAAKRMLARIPRLERVAEWIAGQTVDARRNSDIPPDAAVEQQLLTAATEFLAARDVGETPDDTERRLRIAGRYPQPMVEAMRGVTLALDVGGELRDVTAAELLHGMVFQHDVVAVSGATLVRKGDLVTEAIRNRLRNFATTVGVVEPIRVLVPHH